MMGVARRTLIGLPLVVAVSGRVGVAFAGQAATSKSGEYIDLNVAVSPPVAGTAKTPSGVGVSFDSFTGNRIDPNRVSTNNSNEVLFNRGFGENGAAFPPCRINPTGYSTCSKASQVGTGTGEVAVRGANGAAPTFVAAKLAVYNGKPFKSKAPTLVFIADLGGKPAAELDFNVLRLSRGPYGLVFKSIDFPDASPNPAPPAFSITKFSVNIPDRTVSRKVHGRSVKIHLVVAPTTCSGSWKFAQINTYTNEPPLTANDSQPCVKR